MVAMDNNYKISKIEVKSRLSCKLSDLRKILNNYPGLIPISYGSIIKYKLLDQNKEYFYTLEISRNSISVTINSGSSPVYYMQEALLRLLSVLSVLEEFCEVDIRSLYPYLINVFSSSKLDQFANRISGMIEVKEDNDVELVFAKRINSLLIEKEDSAQKLKEANVRFASLLSRFIILKYGNNVDIKEIERDTEIKEKEIIDALKHVDTAKYGIIQINNDRFSLVRL